MKKIERHHFDKPNVLWIYNSTLDRYISNRVLKTKEMYRSRLRMMSELMYSSLALKEENNTILHYTQTSLQVISGLYKLAMQKGELVDIEVDGQHLKFEGVAFINSLTPRNLSNGMNLAVILRQPEIMQYLLNIPLEITTTSKQITFPTSALLMADFKQRLFRKEDCTSALLEAYKATDPKLHLDDQYIQDFHAFIDAPQLDVYTAYLKNDPELFNQRLFEAITNFRNYWENGEPFNPGDPPPRNFAIGLTSIPLTALAALAFDRGWKVEVESDYIPRFLVEGNFPRQQLKF